MGPLFINFCSNCSLMVYMLARTCSFLGIENMETIITIVCSESPFGGSSRLVESGRLVCVTGWLMGFCMMRSFFEGSFRTDYSVCSKMPFGGGTCRVKAR